MNAQQVGYITLIPSILIVFAIFADINTWRRFARWLSIGAFVSSIAMVIPSLGIVAHLIGAFDFRQGDDGCWVYGIYLDPEATKSAILWAGGWIPILGFLLAFASFGVYLWIDEYRRLPKATERNTRLRKKTEVIHASDYLPPVR